MTLNEVLAAPVWPAAPDALATAQERLAWYPCVARLAPSKHNTQPWRFILHRGSLELWTDKNRALSATDPRMRELVISCGTALHHLEVAAHALGRELVVDVLPEGGSSLLARIAEGPRRQVTARDEALLAAVGHRHTDRGPLDVSRLAPSLPFQMQSTASEHDAVLRLVVTAGDRATLGALVARADRMLARDGGLDAELADWVRSPGDPGDDGVPADRTRGPAASYRAEFVQRDFSGGAGGAAHDRVGEDRPLVGILCTPEDRIADWLTAGRALSAVLLAATVAGANASFLNQPIEVDSLRRELRTDLRIVGQPQLVLRMGAGGPVLPTPRRPIEQIRVEA
ncbi:MAG: nitroreductase [Frankiales bacterium]|nr:nitroreductase [Frankiales bacterium]